MIRPAPRSVAARAEIGAAESRLTPPPPGRITDTDIAAEAADEAATGIQARFGVAVTAQANQRAHDVLRLLA